MIDVKAAVQIAKAFVLDLFQDEGVSDLGLEEVEYEEEEGSWYVTVGFSRPWDFPRGSLSVFSGSTNPKRTYKRVHVKDGKVVSVQNREVNEPKTSA